MSHLGHALWEWHVPFWDMHVRACPIEILAMGHAQTRMSHHATIERGRWEGSHKWPATSARSCTRYQAAREDCYLAGQIGPFAIWPAK
jgi:hypothetical protein